MALKKPTLAQLRKRPALWFLVLGGEDPFFVEPRITMPNGTIWAWNNVVLHPDAWYEYELDPWHEYAIKYYEFAGWL